MTADLTFDLLLAASLLWSAWRTLATPDIFRAVILFIVFGLLLTLGWARLAAPDIALAEAAIGAAELPRPGPWALGRAFCRHPDRGHV